MRVLLWQRRQIMSFLKVDKDFCPAVYLFQYIQPSLNLEFCKLKKFNENEILPKI